MPTPSPSKSRSKVLKAVPLLKPRGTTSSIVSTATIVPAPVPSNAASIPGRNAAIRATSSFIMSIFRMLGPVRISSMLRSSG